MSEVVERNPKIEGSNIIDCIPQTGECPVGCAECFYNGGRFYRTLTIPQMPTSKDVDGKIVRINSGHDSALLTTSQLFDVADRYSEYFFNTSIPKFYFPGPVVFTCNGKKSIYLSSKPSNLMFVRVRTVVWPSEEQDRLIQHYLDMSIPVVLTFMRYYSEDAILSEHKHLFVYGKHVLNEYWKPTRQAEDDVMLIWKGSGVRRCGTNISSLCLDCRNCEMLYWTWKANHES